MSIKIMIFLRSNSFYKIVILSILLFFFNLESKELAKFNDWTAFAEGEGKNLACMAVSKPKKAEGNYSRRGDIFAIVTHLPGQNKWNEFSIVAGYNLTSNQLSLISKCGPVGLPHFPKVPTICPCLTF